MKKNTNSTNILFIPFLFIIPIFFLSYNSQLVTKSSLLNLNTIFLSIILEALPFVLIGVLLAGVIQIFLTEELIRKWIPKNKFMAAIMGCALGAIFPACDCGMVPIIRRLILKGVPLHAAIGFMLTVPLINPIVIYSTYVAFGNNLKIAGLRMILGFLVALIVSLIVCLLFKGTQFKIKIKNMQPLKNIEKTSFAKKLFDMFKHSIDEFFDMGKYLVVGAFLAAFVQTYVSTKALLDIGNDLSSSMFVMMILAFFLSICSTADAFIAASFSALFPITSILAFLITGPMIDLKNTIMLLGVFRFKFVMWLFIFIIVIIYSGLFLLSGYIGGVL